MCAALSLNRRSLGDVVGLSMDYISFLLRAEDDLSTLHYELDVLK